MAWRLHEYLIHGILDNRIAGKVTGELRFHGMDEPVVLELEGDFHRDIRGTRIHLYGDGDEVPADAKEYMQGMDARQVGQTGDITAGLEPADYVDYPYIEWYSANGRVVLELDHEQIIVEPTARVLAPVLWHQS
ncbi:MAG: hypothetical protein ACE37H_04895 [Phycisphaeraceae bacterium]